MFYGASPNTLDMARLLRNNMTEAEKFLLGKGVKSKERGPGQHFFPHIADKWG